MARTRSMVVLMVGGAIVLGSGCSGDSGNGATASLAGRATATGGQGGNAPSPTGGAATGGTAKGGGATAGTATGGAKTGGTTTGGTAGTAGTTGMTYGIPGQSCAGDLRCSGASCCTQIELRAGSFPMGTSSDPARSTDESPEHTATLDAFFLDQFEVTVGRFRRFVEAFDGTVPSLGSGAAPGHPESGWQTGFSAQLPGSRDTLMAGIGCDANYQTWSAVAGARDTMPMNCVNWYLAFAFCVWDGGRLPTEAEWEMAATNGTSNSRFPWGPADPDPAVHAVMNCLGDAVSGCKPTDLLAVGSRPLGANSSGHQDLAGSLWEWTLDYYDATYYPTIGTCDRCTNQAALTPRVVRGGDFSAVAGMLRATARASHPATSVDPYTGFRCARSTG